MIYFKGLVLFCSIFKSKVLLLFAGLDFLLVFLNPLLFIFGSLLNLKPLFVVSKLTDFVNLGNMLFLRLLLFSFHKPFNSHILLILTE